MSESRADARVPARTLRADLAWVAGVGFVLAWLSRLAESPALGGAAVNWAAPALMALFSMSPRRRWGLLFVAAFFALAAALALGGDAIGIAVARAGAFGCEAMAGAWLARGVMLRTGGAATPLTFGVLLVAVAFLPSVAGATVAAALRVPVDAPPGTPAFAARWLATYVGDSYAALALFPLALALRRDPWRRLDRRDAAMALLLPSLVCVVTVAAAATLPRPFAFCSLVLGIGALLTGPRTRFLLVWTCLASLACFASHGGAPASTTLDWPVLNIFLPGIAIALPILVLSVALQRLHQSRAVLRRSRERFRQLYERAPVMLQSLDEHGCIIEVNAQWLATFGYGSAEDVRGLPFERFLAPGDGDGPSARPWHRRLLEAGGDKLHVRLRTAQGRTLDALASAASALDQSDASSGMVLAFEDISVELAMRAEIERERDQLAALTSATTDLAVFLDRDLRYRSVNRAFERQWGLSRDSVIGRHPRDVPGQEAASAALAEPARRALAGESSHFQLAIEFPHGRRMMDVALAPAYDAAGERAGVVATMHDVTARVAAESELQQLVQALQHANEGLEQFARIASHDLREPLNTISQFAGLIQEDYGEQLPHDAARYFALMDKAAVRMKAMLDDVLQFARLERSAHLALESVALDRVFVDLRALLHGLIASTGCELAIATPLPLVQGQASLVELLFQNLLTNAMRYTAPGIAPRVDIWSESIGDLVVVTVADNGIGIPTAELDRVFEPFHKLRTWRQAEGSGLGLAICRRIATAFGGHVWAESEDGRGSRLNVALRAVATGLPETAPRR